MPITGPENATPDSPEGPPKRTHTALLPISNALRSEIKFGHGKLMFLAIQDHLYQKSLGYFDPQAPWQIMQVLALSEMADFTRKILPRMNKGTSLYREAEALADMLEADFNAVHNSVLARTTDSWKQRG